jgi:hypothetical protein
VPKICKPFTIVLVMLLSLAGAGAADADLVINFEGLADEEPVTAQFSGLGVTFSGQAVVLQAGLSLNDFLFPPRSGVNVVSSDLGQINVAFSQPQASVGGFFTHASPVTLTAFNAQNVAVATTTVSGDNTVSGSNSPNEFVSTSSAAGITSVMISGTGTEFTLDDLTAVPIITPEPDIALVGLGLLALAMVAVRVRPSHRPS